jgi:hypothetical protein
VWLDALLDRLVEETDTGRLRKFLDGLLRKELPGKESRAKTAGILLRIWATVPERLHLLRSRAIDMLGEISGQDRIWLHWGMVVLAYPFFRDNAESIGRLLALQDDFTTAQVHGRIVPTWGDRTTTKKAANSVLGSMVDWEVLRAADKKGHFLLAKKIPPAPKALQLWLLETHLMAASADEIEAHQLLRLPESYPFTFNVGVGDLRKHPSFVVHRQGLDMEMVAVHVSRPQPAGKKEKPLQPTLFDDMPEQVSEGRPALARPKATVEPATPPTPAAPPESPDLDGEQCQIEETLRQDDERTRSDRARRVLQVRGLSLVPFGPFAAASAECLDEFRDGHYLGCIALAQSVAEAIVRYVWQTHFRKKPNAAGSFEKNLDALDKKGFIPDDIKGKIDSIWTDRNDYHHLNPSIDRAGRSLEDIAREKLLLLREVEKHFFAFSISDGKLVPKNPEYWPASNGETLVCVRSWP